MSAFIRNKDDDDDELLKIITIQTLISDVNHSGTIEKKDFELAVEVIRPPPQLCTHYTYSLNYKLVWYNLARLVDRYTKTRVFIGNMRELLRN